MTISNPPRPRIVSVVNTFPSGSETFIERKARALMAAGFDVTVAAHQTGTSSEVGGAEPVPRLQLPHPRQPRTWATAARSLTSSQARQRARPLLREFRQGHWLVPIAAGGYDIVHFEFSGIAAQVADLLPHLRPARLAVSCRGAAEQIRPHQDPDRARQLERVFAEVDLIHCVSQDMADTVGVFGASADKIVVNRPAVDTARWSGIGRVDTGPRGTEDAPLRVLSVARLHWKKGFDDAIRAVSLAQANGVHIQYRIAGEGPEREKLAYLRHSLGLGESVELLGWQAQQQVEDLLGWADVFLLPSLSEGISNSALEAMASGVPIVSTRCGGMDEVITRADDGLLTDVGDVSALAEALATLVEPERRAALSAGGQATVRASFDLARQAEVFANAYRTLLSDNSSALPR